MNHNKKLCCLYKIKWLLCRDSTMIELECPSIIQMPTLTVHRGIHLTRKAFGSHPEANNMCSV